LEDRPVSIAGRSVDVLSDNRVIIGPPRRRGATTILMADDHTGALMYRPGTGALQFYCVAASGPQLAAFGDLPDVARGVLVHTDREV